MYILVEHRLKVQRNGGKDIYYIPVVNGSTSHELPFSVPVADIEILAQDMINDYIAPIRFDDIVTLESSIRFHEEEGKVWQRLFEGRLLTTQGQFGSQNTAKLNCVGHADESRYRLLIDFPNNAQDPIPLVNGVALHTLFVQVLGTCVRLHYNPLLNDETDLPVNEQIVDYQIKGGQKYLKDFLTDLEKITGFTWYCTANPTYNSNGSLKEPVTLDFLPLPTTPTTKYRVIQGTPRFISASFQEYGENVYTRAMEFGKTPGGTQCSGWAENVTMSGEYGQRYFIETDTGFGSSQMCADFAAGIVENFCIPKLSGQVILVLTPEARIGDYVECQVPGVTVNGAPVNYYLTVHKVQHNLSSCTTVLDVGFTVDDPDKYLLYFAKMAKQNMVNFIS